MLSAGGAAEKAGVPPGARLLEVNGVSVEKFTHNQLNRKVGLPAETPYMSSPSRPEGQYVSPPVLFPIVCMRLALIRGGGVPPGGEAGEILAFLSHTDVPCIHSCSVLTALAEWRSGDSAGGRAGGRGTVSPTRNASCCTPGRGLGIARQAPVSKHRERA